MMNLLVAALAAGAPASPSAPAATTTSQASELAHAGGCRKSSPPGQCCHAGSQPYHCH
ncbi:hypothetical protein P2H44_11755 [Albimonas sp. CAU 1670]|uniref:hypothetical protein n=1 Tax=Albimonas sp. CAU 1670 TaxID=3032599 RepID=UPI0023DC6A98|nr:hypothetical protein [Albimonas sp. CAU 1670]MDF2233227.1 hypothetical protein [Albimonas sp. CAU 1670]